MQRTFCRVEAIYRAEVSRRPEKKKPPHAICHEFTGGKCPCLPVPERPYKRHFPLRDSDLFGGRPNSLNCVILSYIIKFRRIHPWMEVWLFIHKKPKTHPDKAQGTNNDKRRFPSVRFSNKGDSQRRSQCTHSSACIKNTCCKATVLFGKIFRCSLYRCWEITRFTYCENNPRDHKQSYTDRYNRADITDRSDGRFCTFKANKPMSGENT